MDSLFKKIELLDVSLVERLLSFFSLFLANRKAVWDWKKWFNFTFAIRFYKD